MILHGLPSQYDALKASLQVQDNLGLEAMCAHVRAAQEKMRYAEIEEWEQESVDSGLFARVGADGGGGRRHMPARGGGRQLPSSRSGDRDSHSDRDETRMRCFLCLQQGHSAHSCARRKGPSGACPRCGQRGHDMFDLDACVTELMQQRIGGGGRGDTGGAYGVWPGSEGDDMEYCF